MEYSPRLELLMQLLEIFEALIFIIYIILHDIINVLLVAYIPS
jgi:hypothetical protein